jgi:hypothetical protein
MCKYTEQEEAVRDRVESGSARTALSRTSRLTRELWPADGHMLLQYVGTRSRVLPAALMLDGY